MDRIRQIIARIDELTLRERAVILGGVLALLFMGWYAYLMEPLIKEEKALNSELQTKREQFAMLSDQFAKLAETRRLDPNVAKRERLAQLRKEHAGLQEDLRNATVSLVTPELMPDLLRAVLRSSSGLKLVQLSGIGSRPLLEAQPAAGTAAKGKGGKADRADAAAGSPEAQTQTAQQGVLDGAYRHGIRIELQGDYFATLEYLRRLEGLEWRFFWDSVEFTVGEYPNATTSIQVFTISLSQDWIGT